MSDMTSVGIIGFGSFGSFLASKLEGLCTVKVYDPNSQVPQMFASKLDDVSICDYVVLAIPLEAYKGVIDSIAGYLGKDTVVVDISSVKAEPARILHELLPDRKAVVMHPLFGPQSAASGLNGHTLVMCPEVSDPKPYASIKRFSQGLGLNVVEKSAENHDKDMAYAQGLTFFVARALMRMNIHSIELQTPSFKKLLDLAELESHHSDELFTTIQMGNAFTDVVRQEFTSQIDQIMSELSRNNKC